jgi:hypothetical protein
LNLFVNPEEPLVEGDLILRHLFEHALMVDFGHGIRIPLIVQYFDGEDQKAEEILLWGAVINWFVT